MKTEITAMQQLKLSLNNTHPENWNQLLLHDLDKLNEKEKQHIIDARIELGMYKGLTYDESYKLAEQYYNETFKD